MTKTSSSSCLTFCIICGLLVVSTWFNIQCSQQQFFITTTTQASILVDDRTSTQDSSKHHHQQQQQKWSSMTSKPISSFDEAMYVAQGIIDEGLRPQKEPNDEGKSSHKRRTRNPFNLTSWDQRTSGGLVDEDRMKLSEIYSQANSVFEYGLGESTYIANAVKVPRYAGIDSDAKWVAMARDRVSSTYRFYFADIGPTVEWGYPADRKHIPSKAIYQYQIMPLAAEIQPFDVYMVDGRFRVPCMIASFLHASARGANPNHTIVLLHDCFRAEYYKNGKEPIPKRTNLRTIYAKADHLVEVHDHSGNRLCVYKRKPQTTDQELLQFWQENYDMID